MLASITWIPLPDGEPCGLNDLKAGDLVTVTMETQEGKTFATKIEASKFLAVS